MYRRAEAVARNFLTEASRDDRFLSPTEAQQVMYDLRVHQIELEMQAEELHRTRIELDVDMVERKKRPVCARSTPWRALVAMSLWCCSMNWRWARRSRVHRPASLPRRYVLPWRNPTLLAWSAMVPML